MSLSSDAKLDTVIADFLHAEEVEGPQNRQQWIARHPEFATELAGFFADNDALRKIAKKPQVASGGRLDLMPSDEQRERFEIGSIFAGKYEIFAIKEGGMGRVYLANVISPQRGEPARRVAIKTIADFRDWRERQRTNNRPADQTIYDRIAARFHQEAETWVRIGKRENILWAFFVLDVGRKPYIVMEYADEGDLASWIRERRLALPLCINLAIQFCRGMSQAFQACKLVHRDIKPANVLLTRGHLVKIADFGLSKAFDGTEACEAATGGDSPLSQGGAGTASYMAPEQFASLAHADTRSDIYSFGAMFFEMLTGNRLFQAHTAREHLLQRRGIIPALHKLGLDLPDGVSDILDRCLAFEVGNRFQNFADLEGVLARVYENLPDKVPFPRDTVTPPPGWQIETECVSLLALGKYEKVERRANEGMRLFPHSAHHWINRGVALANLARMQESAECLTHATELSPTNALAWANLGLARLLLGDSHAGLQAAMSAVRLDDEMAEGWWTRGKCEQKLGRSLEAITSFRRAVELRPHDWRGWFYLGSYLFETGHFSDAIQPLREVVRISPNHAESWRLLGVSFGQVDRHKEARQAVDRAVQIDPRNSDAWADRAIVLWYSEGVSDAVKSCLKQSLALIPTNARSLQLLGKMGIHGLEDFHYQP